MQVAHKELLCFKAQVRRIKQNFHRLLVGCDVSPPLVASSPKDQHLSAYNPANLAFVMLFVDAVLAAAACAQRPGCSNKESSPGITLQLLFSISNSQQRIQ